MKRVAQYVVLSIGIIGAMGAIASVFTAGQSREAVWASASLAFVVQMVAFTVVRLMPPQQVVVGWGLGAALRLVAVLMYGLVVATVWRAPVAPALLSFVGFLFVTMVVEPVFLKR